jgi:hypothetical protein
MDQVTAGQALEMLRRQRHSFLNQLQVISGWLQLGSPERALRYLEQVAGRMAHESEVLRQVPPTVGLAVLQLGLEAEVHGIQLQWQVDGWDGEPARVDALVERVRAVIRALATEGAEGQRPEEKRIMIRLGPEGLTVHTPPAAGEG